MTSEAPERIWATPEDGYCTATDLPSDKRDALGFVQYTRADLSPQWRPISEAKRDGREILGWVGDGYKGGWLILSWYKYNGSEAWRDWDQDVWEPTHFMEITAIPEAPNEP